MIKAGSVRCGAVQIPAAALWVSSGRRTVSNRLGVLEMKRFGFWLGDEGWYIGVD